ncbi:M18 family aminopeptidase [Agromyces seonyuensis]|uniref:M18 family aminopeptidase n=1 Tax=Agromyces seonyuensis TaxID=2662446 RepID=A0A6I4NZS3_9MICO|nr:M18 family aminopeptidase [Agromyces seonyuensis]MWB99823.1 M18 family aminopeptidase [Agromyces seonyuensis]
MTDSQRERTADALASFVAASPSSYHAAEHVAAELAAAGFERLDETAEWPSGPGRRLVVRDGAVIAWVQPQGAGATTPFRILGTHTDSPGFKLKPTPDFTAAGLAQAGVEVYGGPLLNSWLDRELEFAGRIATEDGAVHLARTGPIARIPQLAIHLDREVGSGLVLDRQRHTQPIWASADGGEGGILEVLAASAGVPGARIVGHDVLTVDTQRGARFGGDGAFFASGRLDNLSSVWAGFEAIQGEGLGGAPAIAVLAAFDHEELGSESRSGALGPLLDDVLSRISAGLGADEVERRRAFAASWQLSSDAGHAVHPNYPEKHDPGHRPVLGGGVLLKLNGNQRYTTDAPGSALWTRVTEAAGVATQPFVSVNSIRAGSTIGPLSATRLGIRTLDVGVPLLSMHSARELAHLDDLDGLRRAAGAFFALSPVG